MHTVVKPTRTPRAKRESPSEALAKITGSRPIAADPVERVDPNEPHWECQCGERNALDCKTCRRCARVRQSEGGMVYLIVETCDEKLHWRDPENLQITMCGRLFDGQTMIPASCWGNDDRTWCFTCNRARQQRIRASARRRRLQLSPAAAQEVQRVQ